MIGQTFACSLCHQAFAEGFFCWLHIFTAHKGANIALIPALSKRLLAESTLHQCRGVGVN